MINFGSIAGPKGVGNFDKFDIGKTLCATCNHPFDKHHSSTLVCLEKGYSPYFCKCMSFKCPKGLPQSHVIYFEKMEESKKNLIPQGQPQAISPVQKLDLTLCKCGHPMFKHGRMGCMKKVTANTIYCPCTKHGTSTYEEYSADTPPSQAQAQASPGPGVVWKSTKPAPFFKYVPLKQENENENEKIERLVKERLAAAVKEEIEKRLRRGQAYRIRCLWKIRTASSKLTWTCNCGIVRE